MIFHWKGYSCNLRRWKFQFYFILALGQQLFVETVKLAETQTALCLAVTQDSTECNVICAPGETQCAFDIQKQSYEFFSSKCAMAAYSRCHGSDLVQTPLKYCIKNTRRFLTESCPVFCPNYYSPVCGASKYRGYIYKTFTNGCFLDMLNCRGDEDISTYVEVPLQFCQNHAMKNIFKEQVVVSNIRDYEDYDQF